MAEPRFIPDSFVLDPVPYPPLWGSGCVEQGWGKMLRG